MSAKVGHGLIILEQHDRKIQSYESLSSMPFILGTGHGGTES